MRTRSRRTRLLVLATVVLGVAGAGAAGVASAQTGKHRPSAASAARLGPAANETNARRWTRPPRPRPTASPSASATPSVPAPPATEAPTSSPPPTTQPPTSSPPPATQPPATEPPPPSATPPAADTVVEQALAHINAARAAENLPALTLDANLTAAAEAHNALMAGGCGLSHQCPGEAGLGARFTAAGVSWRAAGENVGQGNAQNNPASILAAANGLTDLMLAEVPPNDGHRRNLLNPGFGRIGLAVTRGADGRVWLTQDFVN